MANIEIYELHPAGYQLLSDSEFMNDLSEEELNIQGGLYYRPWFSPLCIPISKRLTHSPIYIVTLQIQQKG